MVTFNSLADWQQYGDGSTSMVDQMLAKIKDNTSAANAFNASQAAAQMKFQEEANAKAMEFNHREAELNRNWQQMMSNTAHQREVADLKAAGLNPVLSATGGNGASVTSGATASGVTSGGAAASADTSSNASMSGLVGSLVASTANRDIADLNATVAMRNADVNAAAQKYASDQLRANVLSQIANDRWMAEHYPNNFYTLLSGIIEDLTGGNGIVDTLLSLFAGDGSKLNLPGLVGAKIRDKYESGVVSAFESQPDLMQAIQKFLYPEIEEALKLYYSRNNYSHSSGKFK